MKKNRWRTALAAGCLMLTLAGCGGAGEPEMTAPVPETTAESAQVPGRVFSMATNGDWTSSFKGKVMERELEELTARTGGAVKIRLYDRSRLGDDDHLISGVLAGTIDMMQSSPASQVSAVPEAAFFDVPGLFSTLEEWNALLSGPYRQVMKQYYADAGLELLDVFAWSWRELSSRVPVREPGDLAGLRIRTIKNPYHEAFWNGLGAVAVPYDYAELYFCLQEGIADAQENLPDVILVDNLYELQSCVTFTRHLPVINAVAMRKELYDSLLPQEREALIWLTADLKEKLLTQMPEEEARMVETLDHDYGLEMLEPSASLQEKIRESSGMILGLLREQLGDEKTNRFLEAVEEVRKTPPEESSGDGTQK